MSAAGNGNANDNDNNNITFTIKDAILYVSVVTLSARGNQKLSKILSKGFEISVYWNERKTKSENKNTTNEYRYFLESNFVGVDRLFALVYSNQDNDSKIFKAKRYNFYDQAIDPKIKQYEEIRKLTTGQGEDYTTRCLLDYEYIKNHYRLIALDLSRQK